MAIGVALRVTPAHGHTVELKPGVPTELTPTELRRYAGAAGRELYWLGPITGRKLEVTDAGANGLFVRYLPRTGAVGDKRASFTTVATYTVQRPYRLALRSGREAGTVSERIASGGIAVWRRSRPSSVYIAYPGSGVMVEIFHPARSEARALALTGRIVPVG